MNKNSIVKVFTDGATVGHNGPLGSVEQVGIGIYIPSLGVNYSKIVDGISNNEAEFKALIQAMHICIQKGVKKAIFHLDSNIVVNRANGNRPKKKKFANERMDNFQDMVLTAAKQFEHVEFIWIPREENSIADSLSKKGI